MTIRPPLRSKTNGRDVVAPPALASVFSLATVQVPAPAAILQKCTLDVVAVGFSSHTASAEPSARASTSARPPTAARCVIGPSTAACAAGTASTSRTTAANDLTPTPWHGRFAGVASDVRLEALAEQH